MSELHARGRAGTCNLPHDRENPSPVGDHDLVCEQLPTDDNDPGRGRVSDARASHEHRDCNENSEQ